MERKTFKIFDEDDFARLTNGIKVAQCMRTPPLVSLGDDLDLPGRLEELSVSEKLFCSCCNAAFDDSTQQRQHYKLDWHRYNLRKRLAEKKAVSEENFSRLADLDDVSSISGSESESEDDSDNADPSKGPPAVLASRHAKVFFENEHGEIFSVYRCLLHAKKDAPERDDLYVPLALKTVTNTKWAIIMLGGGHFAAAIFQGREVIAHKTFHCYTVRKGQGGTQSARDNRSGGSHPKSAGASLRRYNEAALLQHVQEITALWAGDLATCDLIFYRASGHNVGVLFGGRNPPLVKNDPRLRTVPFPTRRATFSEVKRIHDVLATLEVYGSANEFKNSFPQSPRKKAVKPAPAVEPTTQDPPTETDPNAIVRPRRNVDRAKARSSPVRPLPGIAVSGSSASSDDDLGYSDEPYVSFTTDENVELDLAETLCEFGDSVSGGLANRKRRPKKTKMKEKKEKEKARPAIAALRERLMAACSAGDSEALGRCLVTAKVEGGERDGVSTGDLLECLNESVDAENNRLLHVAAQRGHVILLRTLMESGADPSVRNKKGQPPYVASLDKETRNTFRRFFAEFPDKFDYAKSLIPGGLTDDVLKEQAERKRAINKAKRDRTKQKRKEEDTRREEQSERERFLQLTDREKRALAAERRLMSEAVRGGGTQAVVARCFLCATDISGKVPFEYDIHRFCSIVCLKSHRMMHKS